MIESGIWQQIKSNPVALLVSVVLHIGLLVILSISLTHTSAPKLPSKPPVKTVQAVVVDAQVVDAELKKLAQAEKREKQKQESRKQRLEADAKKAREQRKKEEKRLADLKKQQQKKEQEAKQKQLKLEKERKQKQQELAKLEEQRKKEQQRLAAIEEKRKAQEEAERKKQEAVQAEARRKAEEAELQRKLDEEEARRAEQNTRLQTLRAQYIKSIEQWVERKWIPPANMTDGWYCEVLVQQNVLGDVTQVQMLNCKGSEAFKNTVERAVMKASPLPAPPDPQVFDKRLQIRFSPQV